jgi:hypothetical protein
MALGALSGMNRGVAMRAGPSRTQAVGMQQRVVRLPSVVGRAPALLLARAQRDVRVK